MATESILDLATAKNWKTKVGKIIDLVFPKEVQSLIRKHDPNDLYYDTFEYGIKAFEKAGKLIDRDMLDDLLTSAFSKFFTHWRGYHSCRPSSLTSYRTNGIVPLTREFFINEALRLFRGLAADEIIKKEASELNLKTREGLIYFFCDPFGPLERGSNHYLQSGSEALGVLSIRLKLHCKGILAAQGNPYILQCKIPCSHVRPAYRACIYRNLVTNYFVYEMFKGRNEIEIRGSAFASANVVPPENIEKFIPIEQHKLIYGFQPAH